MGNGMMSRNIFDYDGDRIIVEAEMVVDLEAGGLAGMFLCRARTLTASFVRGDAEVDTLMVQAPSAEAAIDKIKRAIETGAIVRHCLLARRSPSRHH